MEKSSIDSNPTVLRNIFGDSGVAKLLDFLTLYRDMDFAKSEISRNAGVAWKTMWRLWPTFEKYDLVKETRRIGKARMFSVNSNSAIVKALNDLAFQIAKYNNQPILKQEMLLKVPIRSRKKIVVKL